MKGASIKCPSCENEVSPKACNLFDARQPYPSNIKKLLDKQNNSVTKDLKKIIKSEALMLKKITEFKIKYQKLKDKKKPPR